MDERELDVAVWRGAYWSPKGALQVGIAGFKERLRQNPQDWEARVGLSSLLYSAAGNARAHAIQTKGLSGFLWMVRAWFLLERAIGWWDSAWEETPVRDIRAEMCDVGQAILRAAARLPWYRHRLNGAEALIERGLRFIDEGEGALPHTRILLHLGRTDIAFFRNERTAQARLDLTIVLTCKALVSSSSGFDPRQFARICRHLAGLCRLADREEGRIFKMTARHFARGADAGDQVLKLD